MLICWRDVIAAWAVVLILAVAAFGTVDLIPSIDRAEASPSLRNTNIPQVVDLPRYGLASPAHDNDLTDDSVDE